MPFRAFDLDEVAETLRDSEQRYRALFERTPAPTLIIDADTLDILGVNDAAMSRYGYSHEEFLARSLRDLWPPFERGTLFQVQSALKAGHDVRGVFRHWSSSQELFDTELVTRSLPFGDARLRVVLAFDVSEHTRSADVSAYLDRASGLLAASLEFTTICRNLASVAAARLGDWCAVHRVHAERPLELAGFAHANPLDELLVGTAVRARQPLPAAHPANEVAASGRTLVLIPGDHTGTVVGAERPGDAGDADRRLAARAAMYLPIHGRGRVLAVLECVAVGDELAAGANNVPLAEELASRAALALDGALRYEEARQRSVPAAGEVGALLALGRGGAGDSSTREGAPAEMILESITDGFLAVDAEWRVTYVNRVAERLLAHAREEMVSLTFWDVFPDVEGTALEENYRRAAATQEVVEFEAFYPGNGAWYKVHVHPSPLGLGIFFQETTAAHRAEEERRDSNRVLHEYADQASDLIILLAPDGRIVYANRAWRDALGYADGEGTALRLQDIVAPEFREAALDSMSHMLAGDSAHVSEVEVVTKDGRRVRVQGRGTCRYAQGQPVAVLGIFRDVTSQRESEAALEAARLATVIANRTRTEFLDRINHELRTPLTGIIGFARLLERNRNGGLSAADVDLAARISRQGRELLAVIEDVLAYTEIEGRRLVLDVQSVDLGDLVEDMAAEFAERAASAGVSIVAERPAGLAALRTDGERVRQILRPLVDNAIKFSAGGTVTLCVGMDPDTGEPRQLEVRDRGIGIPAGLEDQVLEPFEQAASHNARKFGGIGLGLTIARALARLLGFELTLGTREGEGTRAVLSFGGAAASEPTADVARSNGDGEQAERESAELASLLDAIVRASPLAVVAYDPQLRVRLWNEAASRLFGWSAAEVMGVRLPTVPPTDQLPFRELLRRVVEQGSVTDEPMRRQRKDGSQFDTRSSIAPLRDTDGRLIGFVTLVADMTEQIRRDAQLRHAHKMEVIGNLAGGVAHDFNNILTVIGASASFLLEELDVGDPRRRDAEEIRAAGDRAAALTRQLLLFARRQQPERRLVDLRDIVTDTRRMLERLIASNIELATLNAPEECPVNADPGQLEQLVMNLVLNARDAMATGGALVVETRRATIPPPATLDGGARDVRGQPIAPGEYVVLVVSDTGHGIEPAALRHIFEPFYTTKAPGHGTGLGLATVETIVADANGFVQLETEVSGGTTFRVYLPAGSTGAPARKESAEPRPPVGGETVLLVEDEEIVRSIATRILRSRGYSVLAARHGKDALDLAARHDGPIHLLLTDLVMPEMDGHTLAIRLRALRPTLRVMFMSGYTDPPTDAESASTMSRESFVQKPFNAEELIAATRQVLDAPA
jgi:PAS domain S-box-containing protein